MPLYLITLLFTALISLSFGFFTWIKNKNSLVNIMFFWLNIAVFIWSFSLFLNMCFASLIFNRYSNFGAIFTSILWLHFVLAIINKIKQEKIILILGYVSASIVALITVFTNLAIVSLKSAYNFSNYAQAGPIFPMHFLLFFILVSFGIYELAIAYKNSSGIKRHQVKYILYGGLIGFPLGATTYFPAWDWNIYPIGLYLTWLYIPITAYAILRYHLFDISIVLRKSLIFSLLVILVTSFFSVLVFGLDEYFLQIFGLNKITITFLVSFIIAVCFLPIKNFIAKITDKVFFKEQYDLKESLIETSQAIATTLRLDQLTNTVEQSLKKTVKATSVSLFLLDKSSKKYSALITYLNKIKEPVITEEIEQQLLHHIGSAQNLSQLNKIKTELEKYQWALVIPLILKNKLIGLLCLGPKMSGDAFSNTDLQLLNTLSSQTAIAVENASVYEKERKLSETKSEFISVASHRLRTPLSVTKWALSLLEEDKQNLSPKQNELIQQAFAGNNIMIKLINDLLSISKIR